MQFLHGFLLLYALNNSLKKNKSKCGKSWINSAGLKLHLKEHFYQFDEKK